MKRKTLTLAICFLALIAIVSVGFASWIITRPVVDQNQEGSITAETVDDITYQYSVKANGSSSNVIHFGKPESDPTGSQSWLTNEDGQVENLSYSMILSVNYYELMTASNVYVNLQIKETGAAEFTDILATESEFKTAVTNGYLANPKLKVNELPSVDYVANYGIAKANFGLKVQYKTTADGELCTPVFKTISEIQTLVDSSEIIASSIIVADNGTTDASKTKIEINSETKKFVRVTGDAYCVVTVEFNWGTAFDGSNPLEFYSHKEVTEADNAIEALDAINAVSEAGTAYKIIFSNEAKA